MPGGGEEILSYLSLPDTESLMEKLRVAHRCEADESGRIEDCPFGGEGHNFPEETL